LRHATPVSAAVACFSLDASVFAGLAGALCAGAVGAGVAAGSGAFVHAPMASAAATMASGRSGALGHDCDRAVRDRRAVVIAGGAAYEGPAVFFLRTGGQCRGAVVV